jgi:hypothetical protein
MMITPLVRARVLARAHQQDLMEEASRARRIAAAWAYKRGARRWTWHSEHSGT